MAECTATPSGLTSVGATTFTGALTGTASGNLANAALDDTKGNGDTTFIWSADKVFDQLALKAPVDSPIFTTQITTPLIYGSSADNGDITIEGTSSGTKTTSYVILQPTAGNVGIGTSSPTNILSLGNSQAQKFWIENSATDVVGRALTMSAGGTLTGTSVNDVIGGNLILQSGLGTGTGASTISFMTGTTLGSGKVLQTMSEKMTILGNGWVGIGQTGPTANLYVQTSAPGAFEHGIDLINPTMNAGNELGLFIGRSRNTGNQGQIYFQYSGEGSTNNRISIGLYGADDILNVMNTNRVGIGSTSPAYKLSVISNTATDGIEISAESPQLYFTDQSGGEQSGGIGFNNGQFDFYNSVARLTIANSGNVGIGTTTPNRKLSIWDGDAGIQNSGTLGSESLTEGNFTATTKWTDANDFHLAGGITTVTLAGGGTGYTALDVLTVVQAGGAGGTIRVDTVDGSGVILTFTVTSGGTSYYVANSLSVTGGTGSAATFNITVISNTQARYVHSTNAGTLTQTSGNLAVAVRANRWYKLVYPVSTVTAGCTAVLTTGVAATQQTLTITAGTQTLYFLSAASPGNFVISVTPTAGGFTLDDLSLKEVQGGDIYLGGDLYVGNHLTTTGAGAGTLTNAPTAGNPTVYIKIKVGGTYYAVPGWAL